MLSLLPLPVVLTILQVPGAALVAMPDEAPTPELLV